MNLHLPALMLGMLLAASARAASPISIEARGSIRHPGMHTLPVDARLSAAALAARPDESAYMLGAALLREQAIPAQSRLKPGCCSILNCSQHSQTSPMRQRACTVNSNACP